jgi:hypothetical protein
MGLGMGSSRGKGGEEVEAGPAAARIRFLCI